MRAQIHSHIFNNHDGISIVKNTEYDKNILVYELSDDIKS